MHGLDPLELELHVIMDWSWSCDSPVSDFFVLGLQLSAISLAISYITIFNAFYSHAWNVFYCYIRFIVKLFLLPEAVFLYSPWICLSYPNAKTTGMHHQAEAGLTVKSLTKTILIRTNAQPTLTKPMTQNCVFRWQNLLGQQRTHSHQSNSNNLRSKENLRPRAVAQLAEFSPHTNTFRFLSSIT